MSPKSRGIGCLDAHCDSLILREVRGEPLTLSNDPAYHVDLRRLRAGDVEAVIMMVGDSRIHQSLRLIDGVHQLAADRPKDFAVCTSAREVRAANRAGRLAIVMSVEGQAMFEENLGHVRLWHRLGVRMFSLTHGEGKFPPGRSEPSYALQWDAAFFGLITERQRATLLRQSRGLTPFAAQSVDEVGRLGAIVDLAHCNDRAFYDVLDRATGPVCVSHGNCYAQCPHARNLTDDMLKALAKRGGVLGVCFWGPFVAERPAEASVERLCDHIVHALEVMGEDHVGIGSDFDGVDLRETCVVESPAKVPDIWRTLEARGVGVGVIRKIAKDNFLRLLPDR